jgi:hypothetical protein
MCILAITKKCKDTHWISHTFNFAFWHVWLHHSTKLSQILSHKILTVCVQNIYTEYISFIKITAKVSNLSTGMSLTYSNEIRKKCPFIMEIWLIHVPATLSSKTCLPMRHCMMAWHTQSIEPNSEQSQTSSRIETMETNWGKSVLSFSCSQNLNHREWCQD